MNASKTRWCWRTDLAEFRGLTERERGGFLLVLEWFENFRLRHELEAGREAAKAFWKAEVKREGREREKWQLEQWADAIQWYLKWLNACSEAGADHRSLPERLRSAVHSSGARRGLAERTKQCYGAWAARYAKFAGSEHEVMQVATATRFLTSVVADEDCGYSTQKQALNALAHFFKYVLGVKEPVFGVKLRVYGVSMGSLWGLYGVSMGSVYGVSPRTSTSTPVQRLFLPFAVTLHEAYLAAHGAGMTHRQSLRNPSRTHRRPPPQHRGFDGIPNNRLCRAFRN